MINDTIKVLTDLQEIDVKIHALEEEKRKKPLVLEEEDKAVTILKEKLASLQSSHKDSRKEIDQKELFLKEKEDKVLKLNVQLNTIKTNKEYSTLQHEISGVKADMSVLEDEILGFFSRAEQIQKDTESAQKELEVALKKRDEVAKEVNAAVAEVDKALGELYVKRSEFAEKVPSGFMTIYEKIIAHTVNKTALAQVIEEVCQGCFMDVSPQEINELMRGKDIIRCRSCSRILYL
jgi:predicted  nucleic acid-binding Zn-ribbon protein